MVSINLDKVPNKPGVYLWKDIDGNYIYIGMSNNLQKRMKDYFQNVYHSYKIHAMVNKIHSYDFRVVNTIKEAFLLEDELIKKYFPKYNIQQKDSRTYPYLEITLTSNNLEVKTVYKIKEKKRNTVYFGPFAKKSKFSILRKNLKYHIDEIRMQNLQKNNPYIWEETFEFWKKSLSMENKNIIKNLEYQKNKASEEEKYEIARKYKEIIESLQSLWTVQKIELKNEKNLDFLSYRIDEKYIFLYITNYRYGTLFFWQYDFIEYVNNPIIELAKYLNKYYDKNFVPEFLYIENKKDELEIYLNEKIKIKNPKIGIYKEIMSENEKNLQQNIINDIQVIDNIKRLKLKNWNELSKLFKIKEMNSVALIDNSHINSLNPTSGIIYYDQGEYNYKKCRSFNLKKYIAKGDTNYMKIATKLWINSKNFIQPDLIIADGGLQQIHAIKNILKKNNINIPVAGFVKNELHQTQYGIDVKENKFWFNNYEVLKFAQNMQQKVDEFVNNKRRRIINKEIKK